MSRIAFWVAAVGLFMGSADALAAPCRNAAGKFIKCPPPAAAKVVRCKDSKGKFAKCGTSGAKPA